MSRGFAVVPEIEELANPFPGLRPFEFDESHLFFGRDGQSEQLLRKLGGARFVAVVGTSGSGKSSLVRAGLLPDLFGGFIASAGSHWRVAMMRPSNDPLGNLSQALASPDVLGSETDGNAQLQATIIEATLRRGSLGLVEVVRQNRMPANENLLVVVDQFEELFRFERVTRDEQYHYAAASFVKLLLEAARQTEFAIYVVLTMRSDFLGDCSLFWGLPEAVNDGQYLIPRLTRDQRAEAITGPIAVCGGQITQRLVNRLLNDMGDDFDQLPILQHALMRAWDHWKKNEAETRPFDLADYEAIGGMEEALSRHADEAYNELTDERSRLIAERIFKGLTEKGSDNREIRRPVVLKELCALSEADISEVRAVIEIFRREGRSFLMPPAHVPLDEDSLIDISHESLIRNWQRLKAWVNEEALSAQIYRRLAETAALYERGEAGLWRDPDLQIALNWREKNIPNQMWASRYHKQFEAAMEFLSASVRARSAELLEVEQRRKKKFRVVATLALVFAVAFLFALAAFAYAIIQGRAVQLEAKKNSQLLYAADLNLAQQSYEDNNIERGRELLEAHAPEYIYPGNHLETLKGGLAGFEWYYLWRLFHSETRTLADNKDAVTSVSFAPDGTLAYASKDGTLKLLTRISDRESKPVKGIEKDEVRAVAFSPNGEMLAVAAGPGHVKLFPTASTESAGERLPLPEKLINAQPDSFSNLAFSPDGKTLAIGMGISGLAHSVLLWNTETRRLLPALEKHTASINSIAFSPNGKQFVTGSDDGTVIIWNTASNTYFKTLQGDSDNPVKAVAFSSDANVLAVGYGDGTVRLWPGAVIQGKPGEHKELEIAQKRGVVGLAFTPDNRVLAVGRDDGTVQLWVSPLTRPATNDRYRELTTLKGHLGGVTSLTFSPDGKMLATGSNDKTVKLWEISPRIFDGISAINSLALSRDGHVLAVGSIDKTVTLCDVNDLQMCRPWNRPAVSTTSIALSPDGGLLATGAEDGSNRVLLWDTQSVDKEPVKLKGPTDIVNAIAFSPDGKLVAAGSRDKTIRVWDISTQTPWRIYQLPAKAGSVKAVAFSPDARVLAAGSGDGVVTLWNMNAEAEPIALSGFARAVTSVAFSSDGRMLAAGSEDTTTKLWNVASLEPSSAEPWNAASQKIMELATLKEHRGGITSTVFSPDSKTLATADSDGTIKLWSVTTFRVKELITLKGHAEEAVTSLVFAPDGKWLASGSLDNTVRFWSAATGDDYQAQRRVGRTNE
jgi:WD40 repeat protein